MVLAPSRVNVAGQFVLRTFEIECPGVEGQVAVIAYEDANGEGWCDCWSNKADLAGERIDKLPGLSENNHTALHGILLDESLPPGYLISQWVSRCDVRSDAATFPLARSEALIRSDRRGSTRDLSAVRLASHATEATTGIAVKHHLAKSQRAKGPRGIYYVGAVLTEAPVNDGWRDQIPNTVVTWQRGKRKDISVADLLALNEIIIPGWRGSSDVATKHPKDFPRATPIINWADMPTFVKQRVTGKLRNMNLVGIESSDKLWLLHFSAKKPKLRRSHPEANSWIAPGLGRFGALGCSFIYDVDRSYLNVLNQDHAVIKWLDLLRGYAKTNPTVIQPDHVEAAWRTAGVQYWKMDNVLARWAAALNLPSKLRPPTNEDGGLVTFNWADLDTYQTVPPESS